MDRLALAAGQPGGQPAQVITSAVAEQLVNARQGRVRLMFWIGLFVGLIIGGTVGAAVVDYVYMADDGRADEVMNAQTGKNPDTAIRGARTPSATQDPAAVLDSAACGFKRSS